MNKYIYRSLKILIHIGIMIFITATIVIIFFFVYLPYTTPPNALVIVPDLRGKSFEQATEILSKNGLRYEISDSNYYSDFPPKAILSQSPKKNDTVKVHRKIYLTINREIAPSIIFPNIVDNSLKNARLLLKSHRLLLGEITYIDDVAINAILGIQVEGNDITKEMIKKGYNVPIGTQVDLTVGNGLGKAIIKIPNLVCRSMERTEDILLDIGLKKGNIHYIQGNDPVGTIVSQLPSHESKELLRVGDKIDLWVIEKKVDRYDDIFIKKINEI